MNINEILKNRAKSWRTTLLGLAILTLLSFLLYTGKSSVTDSFSLFMVGISLLISDDKLFMKNFLNKTKEDNKEEDNKEESKIE